MCSKEIADLSSLANANAQFSEFKIKFIFFRAYISLALLKSGSSF
jgi:hypothetical protein